jgi:hypothetical protein
MTLARVSDNTLDNFFSGNHSLFHSFDVNDEGFTLRRAIELQGFLVSLYYPLRLELSVQEPAHSNPVDVIVLARRHAALKLYRHYTSIKGYPSLKNVQIGLATNLKYIEILLQALKGYLALEKGGLSAEERDISPQEYQAALLRKFAKSKAIAILIKAYITNGQAIVQAKRYARGPFGIKVMREALCDSGNFKQTERTFASYYYELEQTAVFHYLAFSCDCEKLLVPTNPLDPNFSKEILKKASYVEELKAISLHYNKLASMLNNKYGFSFRLIESIPQPEGATKYDSLKRGDHDDKLAIAISKVIGTAWSARSRSE